MIKRSLFSCQSKNSDFNQIIMKNKITPYFTPPPPTYIYKFYIFCRCTFTKNYSLESIRVGPQQLCLSVRSILSFLFAKLLELSLSFMEIMRDLPFSAETTASVLDFDLDAPSLQQRIGVNGLFLETLDFTRLTSI